MTDKTGRLEADDREPQVMGRVNRDVIGREGEAVAVLNSEGRKLPDGCPLYTYSPIADLLQERAELLSAYRTLQADNAGLLRDKDYLLHKHADLMAEVERLRKRLEIIDGHEKFDGVFTRDVTIQELESEVERLREGIQDGDR